MNFSLFHIPLTRNNRDAEAKWKQTNAVAGGQPPDAGKAERIGPPPPIKPIREARSPGDNERYMKRPRHNDANRDPLTEPKIIPAIDPK